MKDLKMHTIEEHWMTINIPYISLVPPTQPLLSVVHAGVGVENPLLGVGEEVVVECSTTGGNPAPSLALYVGEQEVATTVSGSTIQYSLTVQPEHDSVQVYCTAYNTMVHTPVHSTVQVLRLKCKKSVESIN